jgi:membrane associated rhomboid family serine protease
MSNFSRGNILGSLPQVTKVILIINVILFLLDQFITRGVIGSYLALYSIHTQVFKPYQLVTHMFIHGGWGHILFNMLGLFMFGRVVETVLGSKKFFILYFLSGIGAAALQLTIYYFQGLAVPMVGASGAIFGISVAFAMLFPNVELMIILFPVPIKAKYLVPIYLVVELFSGIASFNGDHIAHFAHIGGAIVGFLLIKFWKKNQFNIY